MEFFSCCRTKWHKNVVLKEKTGKFYDECHRHRAFRAVAPRRRHSTVRGLARTCLAAIDHKIASTPSSDDEGTVHKVVQGDRGEQGDPFMPHCVQSDTTRCSARFRRHACPVNTCVRSRIASVITQLGRVVAGRHREMAQSRCMKAILTSGTATFIHDV